MMKGKLHALFASLLILMLMGAAIPAVSAATGSSSSKPGGDCDDKHGDHNGGHGGHLKDCDSDGDGIPDVDDNCPNVANPGQNDDDGDGKGNACDGGDTVLGKRHVRTLGHIRHYPASRTFRGWLDSSKAKCIRNRTVKLFKYRPGPNHKMATRKTARNGHWKVRRQRNPKGRFYAKTTVKKFTTKSGLRVICDAHRSGTLKLPRVR
jgi:hypothetical protein